MRYRPLSPTGDYTINQPFLYNTPAAVGQAVQTRLLLDQGEWFLDVTEGTPYATLILGVNTKPTYDAAIRDRILGTEGVTEITDYFSSFNPTTRILVVTATIATLYGTVTISQVF